MTAHFHGTLADHYAGLLAQATDPLQRSIARAALKYHERKYKQLNDYVSHKTVLPRIQGNYLCSVPQEFV